MSWFIIKADLTSVTKPSSLLQEYDVVNNWSLTTKSSLFFVKFLQKNLHPRTSIRTMVLQYTTGTDKTTTTPGSTVEDHLGVHHPLDRKEIVVHPMVPNRAVVEVREVRGRGDRITVVFPCRNWGHQVSISPTKFIRDWTQKLDQKYSTIRKILLYKSKNYNKNWVVFCWVIVSI